MKNRTTLNILLLLIVSSAAYLPWVGKFGYYNDDWYLMYSAGAYGPGIFWDIFSIDRPLRALVMVPAYILFGGNPLYYNLSAYLFRFLGTVALFWSLDMLWRGRRSITVMIALLFLIYPGFLSQPNAIDYQSHLLSLAAALFSVALMLKAKFTENRMAKATSYIVSVLLGWFYLGQIEWYIGVEFFRWACIFLIFWRQAGTWNQKTVKAIRWGYPLFIIPLVFLTWRLFFFTSERGATDVGLQFGQFQLYPIQTIYHWGIQILQDLFDVMFSAWAIPLSQLMGYIQQWGIVLAVITTGFILFVSQKIKNDDPQESNSPVNMTREALLLGGLTAIAGLLPVIMVNRQVTFPAYSRYTLISSIGVSIFIVTVLQSLSRQWIRSSILAILFFIALLTHQANAIKFTQATSATKNFWWQVSWRVPQLQKNTTLVASYPNIILEEDYFIWGPANLIYYPEKQKEKDIQPALFATILNQDTVKKVQAQEGQDFNNRRNIITYTNYRNILVLTQPTESSCVHMLDGAHPEFSRNDPDAIRAVGPYSEMDHVLVDETPHAPPSLIFGPEPSHNWCYYYQKADLARQRLEWSKVLNFGEQAQGQGLEPGDLIEWMPFLQAYAVTGDVAHLIELAPAVNAEPYVSRQACEILSAMPDISDSVIKAVKIHYCVEQ